MKSVHLVSGQSGEAILNRIRLGNLRSLFASQRTRKTRRGAVLIVVLVCMVAATTILLAGISASIQQRHRIRTEIQLEQTHWMLDAGIGIAIEKYKQTPDFEDFEIDTDATLQNYSGSVSVVVVDRNEKQVKLRVQAKLKGTHELGPVTQRTREIVLNNDQLNITK